MLTRRKFLRAAPASALAASLPPVAMVAALTPDERVGAAIAELRAALEARYPGLRVIAGNALNAAGGAIVVATEAAS